MIINNNIPALNTFRQMNSNNLAGAKSLEKLSSGLRINRAGDDAAGLAISEKMRAQVRGLDQASRNSQDGISLIQTAEGALQETHSILQRMRELATQAANDTNVDVDREEIQKEINQLTSEVNRIGNTTEFNTKKLLKSDGASAETIQNIKNGIENHGWLAVGEQMISDFFGLDAVEGHKLIIKFENNPGSSTAAYVQALKEDGSEQILGINLATFSPSTGVSGENQSIMYSDRILAHEMAHAVMNSAYGAKAMGEMPSWFKEGTAEFISGADDRLERYIGDGAGGIDSDALDALIARGVVLLGSGNDDWGNHAEGAGFDYAAGYAITKFIDSKLSPDKEFSDFMKEIKSNIGSGDNGNLAIEKAIVSNTTYDSFEAFKSGFSSDGATYISNLNIDSSVDIGSIAGRHHNGSESINAADVIDNSTAQAGQSSLKFEVVFPDSSELASSVKFQIGANQGQSMTVDLKDMRSSALGIAGQAGATSTSKDGEVQAVFTEIRNDNRLFGVTDGTSNEVKEYALDVSTHENATAAIQIFNDAIERVSAFRSDLGAAQNRLEHTISNLNNASENLQAAESRIRDVDMAREVMEMTRANILGQASQAMLAQANQKPQSVLQLLG